MSVFGDDKSIMRWVMRRTWLRGFDCFWGSVGIDIYFLKICDVIMCCFVVLVIKLKLGVIYGCRDIVYEY